MSAPSMTTAVASAARRMEPIGIGLGIGALGLVLSAIGFVVDPRQAYASWLAAFAAGVSIALGALILVAITHLTGARWFDPLRRLTLDIASTFPVFALLFIVLLPGLGHLYPWVRAAPIENAAYLNVPFFLGRAAAYFVIWILISLLLRHWATRQGRDIAMPPSSSARGCAAMALPVLGFSLTFAAFDWLMSLAPAWVSTVFGVYWFAGGVLAALGLIALVAYRQGRDVGRTPPLAREQAYALGALTLTFVVFWAYIAYCQYFIIWIADVPAEIVWYVPRLRGTWGGLALVLLLGQFGLPLLALLFHAVKVNATMLAVIGGWLLVMHYFDTYWLVLPAVHPSGVHPHWLDLTALAAVGGTTSAWIAWLQRPR